METVAVALIILSLLVLGNMALHWSHLRWHRNFRRSANLRAFEAAGDHAHEYGFMQADGMGWRCTICGQPREKR